MIISNVIQILSYYEDNILMYFHAFLTSLYKFYYCLFYYIVNIVNDGPMIKIDKVQCNTIYIYNDIFLKF